MFAKPPRVGAAKTRLAASIGTEPAARLARAFLADTWAAAQGLEGARIVLATTEVEASFGLPGDPERWDQGGGDLGARLERVARRALELGPWFIALGADTPGFPPEGLRAAVGHLERGRAAVGPAEDGGYWLLGLATCPRGLLADLPWSRPDTCAATCARLEQRGLPLAKLRPWFDIDRAPDLERFRLRVPRERAPRTWAVLDALASG